MNVIETQNLTKCYGRSRGIIDLNLRVEEGDFFGFIGPNGAGKSTTIRTLLGLSAPTGGNIRIFGKDIRQHREELLANVGYMPSETAFYRNMTAGEVIRFSAGLRQKDCHVRAGLLCERLGLDVDKKIRELSLGSRKKVSIVCALQHDPALCILDEPTSGLDPFIQREFFTILKEQSHRGGTIFFSSHVLSEVQKYCRHACLIREGRLLVQGGMEQISHTGTKRIQIKGITSPPALEGIKDIHADGDNISFLYSGDPKILLNALAALPLTDINITDPDLEEIFLHYYIKENGYDTSKT